MAGGDKRQQFMSQITKATGVVYNQLGRLTMLEKKLASIEAYYFDQITSNIKSGNNSRTKMLATELSNLRRLRRSTQHTNIALEAIVIRFSTINEFAMILDTIDLRPPVASVRLPPGRLPRELDPRPALRTLPPGWTGERSCA